MLPVFVFLECYDSWSRFFSNWSHCFYLISYAFDFIPFICKGGNRVKRLVPSGCRMLIWKLAYKVATAAWESETRCKFTFSILSPDSEHGLCLTAMFKKLQSLTSKRHGANRLDMLEVAVESRVSLCSLYDYLKYLTRYLYLVRESIRLWYKYQHDVILLSLKPRTFHVISTWTYRPVSVRLL